MRIALVAGESSGDRLGAGLIRSLRAGAADVEVAGVAGPAMREAGCRAMLDCSEFAVMGLAEIVGHLPRLWALRRRLLRQLAEFRPDIFIGIDSPELNLGLAARMKRQGVRTVQYVCPSVWAWRAARVRRIRRCCDLVLCLLPFEPERLRAESVQAEFVGHPVADEEAGALGASSSAVRDGDLLIALLPGSRSSEIGRIGPPIARAAAWLAGRRPGVRFATASATARGKEQFEAILRLFAPQLAVRAAGGNARELLREADLALAASGTVTMEAMVCACPLVVAYRVSPLTAWLARTFRLLKTPFVALPNVLAGRELAPELLQEKANGENLGQALLGLYDAPGRRQAMRAEFARIARSLGRDASDRAAEAIFRLSRNL